jgi:hypothetical protein
MYMFPCCHYPFEVNVEVDVYLGVSILYTINPFKVYEACGFVWSLMQIFNVMFCYEVKCKFVWNV